MANYFLSSAYRYHPCADSGGQRRTHAVLRSMCRQLTAFFHTADSPCSHPRAAASEDNAALGQLTGKPAGARPDYRGCWCAVSRGHPGQPNPPSPQATLGQLCATPWELPPMVGCGIAWTRTLDVQTIGRILHSTWSAFTRCATREPPTPTCYGHTVPLSDGGKAFCIIYSVIGIPFTLLFLTAVVQRIMVYVTRGPVTYIHTRWGFSKQLVALVHALVLGLVTASCFFFIPAAAFSSLEDDWNFLESFYFCFISLSTIGLGDYVPGEGYNQKFRQLYKIGITFYLMLGLIAMLVVLETFCELQELKQFRKMFYLKKEKAEDRVHIIDHEHLSFSSVSDQAASLREDKLNEPFMDVPPLTYSASDFSSLNR
ncbi:UNVERIFIED_CONTAM: hypothetical protein FKN15_057115 [Acipenser sinensis]